MPQLSLFEQAQADQPSLSDEAVVRRLCEALLDEAEIAEPPVPVEMLASLRGISSIEEADQPFAGMLRPGSGGLEVRVRRRDGSDRQRFTICHEAAHTLFPGYREQRQYRCNGERTWLERMCDLAGAELLLPRRFFEPDLRNSSFDLEGIEQLARRYRASIEATARRAVALWHEPAMLVVLRQRHKPSEAGQEEKVPPKLRVDYSFSQDDWPFVLRHKSASETGLGRTLAGEILDEVGTIDELCAEPVGPVEISARRFGRDGRVLALVSPANKPQGRER